MAKRLSSNGATEIKDLAFSKESLDFSRHLPYQLSRTVNLLQQVTISYYLKQVENSVALSVREYRVIVIIAKFGPITPAECAEKTGMDRASVTRACAGLRQHGLIEAVRNSRDARSKFLVLTREGATLCDQLFPLMRERAVHLESTFSSDEADLLISLLGRLRVKAAELLENETD